MPEIADSSPRPGEIFRALAVFVEPPSPEHEAVAASLGLGSPPEAADHTDLFDFQLFPFASVYLGGEGMQGGEARDRIAGFWRVLELAPPRDPDHLTVLLAAYGALLDRAEESHGEEAESWHHVAEVFQHEHLLSWLPLFLHKVRAVADGGFYAGWSEKLLRVLAVHPVDDALAETLPAALREAPSLPDPRAQGGAAFLDGLLAPVRTGFILTRDDLRALARRADIGSRIGERKYVLEALLSQDGRSVLEGLAGLAERAMGAPTLPMPAVTATWWRHRAEQTRDLLAALASEAG